MDLDYQSYQIAYLSMEIALEPGIKNYAGGLGVLAGDLLKSAADARRPLVGLTLLHDLGYLEQVIDSKGHQHEAENTRHDLTRLEKLSYQVNLTIGKKQVIVGVWRYLIIGQDGFVVPVFLLDTNLPENDPTSREITRQLYRGSLERRLEQEIVLGRGGVKILAALGFSKLRKFHINEGHGSLAAVELFLNSKGADEQRRLAEVREKCVFTTHTPLKEANDVFKKSLVLDYQPDFPKQLLGLLEKGRLDMTRAALYFSSFSNAVSRQHQATAAKIFPDFKIDSITNGVHAASWVAPEMRVVFDKYLPGWRQDNQKLDMAETIPLTELWQAHQAAKNRLLSYVEASTGQRLRSDRLTIVFARRFAIYKRPELVLADIDRLKSIAQSNGGLQIIFAGKAHPQDKAGLKLLQRVWQIAASSSEDMPIVFLENYNLELANHLIAGADLWLNTPLPPFEACGTSGMKVSLNGGLQLSVLDGWWPEGYFVGQTGWAIDARPGLSASQSSRQDSQQLYDILENEIVPLYYQSPDKWHAMMSQAISRNGYRFSAQRSVEDYWQRAYNN